MNSKLLYAVIVLLLLSNSYFLLTNFTNSQNEVVAKVGSKEITSNMWEEQLTEQYGQDVLKEMINREVVYQLAKKQGISIADEVIDKEVSLYKIMYDQHSDHSGIDLTFNEESLRKDINYILLLEELYTQDVIISDEEIREFYEQNKSMYEHEELYLISHIVVSTKEEANEIIAELDGGSSFDVLAIERSTDILTAEQGGTLGYIDQSSVTVPEQYIQVAKRLSVEEYSGPIETSDGYAVILVSEKVEGTEYSFDDMKGQIRRQLALQQIDGEISAEHFWNELGVEWKYEQR
jgi:foldase protein PrsA